MDASSLDRFEEQEAEIVSENVKSYTRTEKRKIKRNMQKLIDKLWKQGIITAEDTNESAIVKLNNALKKR